MSTNTRLSIIIVNYNTKALLRQVLSDLEQAKRADWQVIVVDQNSGDGSSDMVREEFRWTLLVKSLSNKGFSAGNNLGIMQAKGEYVMLLNSDTRVAKNAGEQLESLLKFMDENPMVAVVSPKVVLSNGALDPACHRGFPTPWNALAYFTGLERLAKTIPEFAHVFGGYHQVWGNLETIHEIDACTGAAMIVRQSAIQKVGGLDESFFMYGEDLDWCYRFRQAGYKVVFHPGATITHLKHQSGMKKITNNMEDIRAKRKSKAHFYDTMLQFYRKHHKHRDHKILQLMVECGIATLKKLKGA